MFTVFSLLLYMAVAVFVLCLLKDVRELQAQHREHLMRIDAITALLTELDRRHNSLTDHVLRTHKVHEHSVALLYGRMRTLISHQEHDLLPGAMVENVTEIDMEIARLQRDADTGRARLAVAPQPLGVHAAPAPADAREKLAKAVSARDSSGDAFGSLAETGALEQPYEDALRAELADLDLNTRRRGKESWSTGHHRDNKDERRQRLKES